MPLTYMNLSGEAVTRWSRRMGVAVTGLPEVTVTAEGEPAREQACPAGAVRPLVVCDDLNLPLGSVRLRAAGSSGGQNGLASVIENLGGEFFPRLRLGVAPVGREVAPADWPDYVLADFTPDEVPVADEMVAHAADALEFWLENGLEGTISRFNRRIRPPVPDPED
jgi:PTH1 family peptidyl-tRNA hydrolase